MAKKKKKDEGHDETESVLSTIEQEINAEYAKAEAEIQEKLDDYLSRFEIKDKLKKQAVENGQITQSEYDQWRVGQIAIGQRWEEMKDTISDDLTNTAEIAKSISYGHMPEVYAINHNYGTYQVEQAALVDTSYTLYDRQSVEHLFKGGTFYHKAGRKVTAAINSGKQKAWDKRQVQSVMTQALLQGESIGKIATRLSKTVGDKDRKACIRNARTMATGVQNAGRVDSYERAEKMGIDLMQEWVATLDNRTRHEHRILDGQRVKVGEKFHVDGYEIAYPADPTAEAFLVYNCRCTLVPVLKGFETDSTDLSLRNTNHMEESTYEEWKNAKTSESHSITKQDEIETTMKAKYNAEYKTYRNGSDKMAKKKDNDWTNATSHVVTKEDKKGVMEYAASKGINIENLNYFDGDVDLLKSEIDALETYMTKLPTSRKVSLTVRALDDEDFGSTRNITITLSQKAMRNRIITKMNLNANDGEFAATTAEGIVIHEYGHVYSSINGINGLAVAKQAYYNIYNKNIDDDEMIDWLEKNISTYSIERKGKEIVSEVLAKDNDSGNDFTREFVKELGRRSVK